MRSRLRASPVALLLVAASGSARARRGPLPPIDPVAPRLGLQGRSRRRRRGSSRRRTSPERFWRGCASTCTTSSSTATPLGNRSPSSPSPSTRVRPPAWHPRLPPRPLSCPGDPHRPEPPSPCLQHCDSSWRPTTWTCDGGGAKWGASDAQLVSIERRWRGHCTLWSPAPIHLPKSVPAPAYQPINALSVPVRPDHPHRVPASKKKKTEEPLLHGVPSDRGARSVVHVSASATGDSRSQHFIRHRPTHAHERFRSPDRRERGERERGATEYHFLQGRQYEGPAIALLPAQETASELRRRRRAATLAVTAGEQPRALHTQLRTGFVEDPFAPQRSPWSRIKHGAQVVLIGVAALAAVPILAFLSCIPRPRGPREPHPHVQ